MKQIELNQERMDGGRLGWTNGFLVNHLYGLNDLLTKHCKPDYEVLEVGSNNGVSSQLIASHCCHLTCIDPTITQRLRDVAVGAGNITLLQQRSNDFLPNTDSKYDLIYIDAHHTYNSLTYDITHSLPLLTDRGFVCGHDYTRCFPGCMRAVNEAFSQIEIFSDSSWVGIVSGSHGQHK